MGEGTVAIKIAAGSASDATGNFAAASVASDAVKVDNTAAIAQVVTIASNNSNSAYAKAGDTISVSLTVNEPLKEVRASILGRSTTIQSNNDKTVWTVSYTIPQNTTIANGAADFNIVTVDLAGNVSNDVTSTTNASSVTMDFTAH